MVTKVVDSKGRVALGAEFAGKTVIIERERGQIIIKPAVVLPENEAWLFKNAQAKQAVLSGIEEARQGKFSKSPPNLDANAEFVAKLRD